LFANIARILFSIDPLGTHGFYNAWITVITKNLQYDLTVIAQICILFYWRDIMKNRTKKVLSWIVSKKLVYSIISIFLIIDIILGIFSCVNIIPYTFYTEGYTIIEMLFSIIISIVIIDKGRKLTKLLETSTNKTFFNRIITLTGVSLIIKLLIAIGIFFIFGIHPLLALTPPWFACFIYCTIFSDLIISFSQISVFNLPKNDVSVSL